MAEPGRVRGTRLAGGAAKPFRPYVYQGEPEPPAVTEARRRWRESSMVGGAPDPLDAIELAEIGAPLPDAANLAPCGRCAELEEQQDGLRAQIRALEAEIGTLRDQAARAAAPPPPAVRCRACGYLTSTVGHRTVCGE